MYASWQGNITTTGGRVAAWFESSGTMSLRINGTTFSGQATNAGDIAYCDFDGFTAGQTLTAEVLLDGEVVGTRSVWTAKDTGTVKGMWMSCVGVRHGWGPALKWVLKKRPDILFFLGDMVYLTDGNTTVHGLERADTEGSYAEAIKTDSTAWNTCRVALLQEGFQKASQICPIIFQIDDHEMLSDWRDDVTQMGAQFAWIDSQEKLDAIRAARTPIATGTFLIANPGDENYCSLTYGPAHFIVPDLITERAGTGTTTMMGATQLAWEKSELENAAPFKMLMHTKTATTGNADSWYYWGGLTDTDSQLVDIWDHIVTNEITTVAVLTGDKHWPHIQYEPNPAGLETTESVYTPYLGICPCPANQFFTESGVDTDDIVFRTGPKNAVGYFEITATEAKYEMLGMQGPIGQATHQLAGSNAIYEKPVAVG